MADFIDEIEVANATYLTAALSHRRPELPRTGACHNCAEPLTRDGAFCDADCRRDYELRTR